MASSPKTITVQHAELARDIADVGKKLIDISMGLSRGVEVAVEYTPANIIPTEPGLYRLTNNMVVELTKNHGWRSPNGLATVDRAVRESTSFLRLTPQRAERMAFAESVAAYWDTLSYADQWSRALRGFADGKHPIPGTASSDSASS